MKWASEVRTKFEAQFAYAGSFVPRGKRIGSGAGEISVALSDGARARTQRTALEAFSRSRGGQPPAIAGCWRAGKKHRCGGAVHGVPHQPAVQLSRRKGKPENDGGGQAEWQTARNQAQNLRYDDPIANTRSPHARSKSRTSAFSVALIVSFFSSLIAAPSPWCSFWPFTSTSPLATCSHA